MNHGRRRFRALLGAAAAALLAACIPAPLTPIGPSAGVETPAPGGSVRDYTLTAEPRTLELKPGLDVRAWTYNGTSPGPELQATVGDVVRVRLRNQLPVATTIHWHGIELPNGQDGVAGVTQDALPPGGIATYSFRVMEAGTYWYHAHQDSSVQEDRGLYGTLVVLPREGSGADLDRTIVYDEWPLGLEVAKPPAQSDIAMRTYVTTTANGRTGSFVDPIATTVGQRVRLRLVNAGYEVHWVATAVPVTIAALDGHEISGGPLITEAIPLGPAERVDILFIAPAQTFSVRLVGAFPPDAEAAVPVEPGGQSGTPLPDPVSHRSLDLLSLAATATIDPWPDGTLATRNFTLNLTQGPMPGMPEMAGGAYGIDGGSFPATPVLRVTRGDTVEITFRNQSREQHWMHLHGHSFRVLLRDSVLLPGRLVKDTVSILPGQSVTIAFKADNPGWWMIHCHQLLHAASGMMALLAYDGSPRLATLGGPFANAPD